MVRVYEEIVKQAALEAAASATDAHGAGHEPEAWLAYEFIADVWAETDEASLAYLPTDMPAEFEAAYEAALGRRAPEGWASV
jgi:hypothetical protein